jgi:hypothetical protein
MVERAISVHQDLLALALNVFKFWQKPPEIGGWQGEQEPVARPT